MAKRNSKQTKSPRKAAKDMTSWRPGSEPDKAKQVGGAGDFGVPAASGSERDRQYVSENTKMSDPGGAMPYAWENDGVRDHGAGARDSGPGSGSGGDIDTDFVGVGTGGSTIAASGPGDAPGADDTDGTPSGSAPQSSSTKRSHAANKAARRPGSSQDTGAVSVAGSTVNHDTDARSQTIGQGADAATNPARGDDSFAGEISSGEASGDDNPISPSSDD